MLINGWDGGAQAWGKITIHAGMRAVHNMDLGVFRVLDWNEESGNVMVEREYGTGNRGHQIVAPYSTYHISELMAV